ncbi:MAG: 2-succinyl-5-enolpyruvyl-6-hydroxy-3-cyclohexene-1-carboxylic-acid synthase [Bacteroidetes bacterium]|nr:2-succinyl-5-enolpyruvyl-6-hydroxy-3-cyclohexene-1-carboxylic-acid synthase [Bacteroidota bacterium]MDA0906715.1 2-succinyl-5-enolpyruvyl-6-hydroxy-3-cyclohexene-1-carboxylic-acid synthase [Bacteroidota bacterium]
MSLTPNTSTVQAVVPETQRWADAQFDWCRGFAESLVRIGLTHVVVSPGSRSTPMVLALEKTPGLQTTVVLDERSAAFMALGLSKNGTPAAFLCTSGTATAHAYAPMWEAIESRIPMIVLTADRPPRLRGKGASQTIDQVGMFGSASVASFDITQPLGFDKGFEAGREAHRVSVEKQGPVHVNMGFDKPFEPTSWTSRVHDFVDSSGLSIEPTIPINVLSLGAPSQGFQVHESKSFTSFAGVRPVLVLGPVQGFHEDELLSQALSTLASQIPTLCETGARQVISVSSSSVNPSTVNQSSVMYGCSAKPPRWSPSSILWCDRSPYSPALLAWMEWCQVQGIRLIQCSWNGEIREPFGFDAESIKGVSFATLTSWILGHEEEQEKTLPTSLHAWLESLDTDWYHQWEAENYTVTSALSQRLEAHALEADASGLPMDSEAIHHVLEAVPHDIPVMVGNSMIPRDVTAMQPASKHPWVIAQRGVAGIDGNLSTAMGLSLGLHNPLVCLVGDLTMLHDMTALLSARITSYPLVIVVINNGGGKIFDNLPIAQQDADVLKTYFTTPQSVSLEAFAHAFDAVEYVGIRERSELASLPATLSRLLTSTQGDANVGGVTVVDIQTDGTRYT